MPLILAYQQVLNEPEKTERQKRDSETTQKSGFDWKMCFTFYFVGLKKENNFELWPCRHGNMLCFNKKCNAWVGVDVKCDIILINPKSN